MSNAVTVSKPASPMMAGAFAALTLALSGCAGSYGAGQSTPASVGTASTVYEGTVTGVSEVQIRPDNSVLGAVTGAALGGIAGAQVGGGDASEAAGTIGGAVIGGVAGNEAGKALNTRPGYAYIVRLSTGEVREIIQGADIYIAPGTLVNVIYREDGVRVTPVQYSAAPPVY
ncbi:MAG: glycine zipper 2TM domain-containing protein [Pseudomonadota bacterium]